MAASDSKPDESRASEHGKCKNLPVIRNNLESIKYSPSLDAIFYLLTIVIFTSTVLTDILIVIEHYLNAHKSWAFYTILIAIVPSFSLQTLSLKWYQSNGNLTHHHWISHIFQIAILHRFCSLLNSSIKTMKKQLGLQQRDCNHRLENDAYTLNLFSALLVSVPQIIFQLYVMAMLQQITIWTCASIVTSLCSLTWSLTAYALLINRTNQDKSHFTWSSMMIQGFWKGGMLISRIAALVLASICFKTWIVVIFGIHTLGMTVWIVQQATNFCFTAIEELAYKCLIGAVYFFDFLRLTENQVKYHVCIFYSVIILQNAIFYAVYLVSFKDLYQMNILIISTVLILGGTFVGAVSMLIHFCMFQNFKTIKLCNRVYVDSELSSKMSPSKSLSGKSPNKKLNNEVANDSAESITPDITADKKSLLTNIVQNSDSIEKGIINTSFIKNDETNVTVQVVVEDNKVMNVDVSVENLQNQAIVDKKFEDSCSVDISVETLDNINNSSTDSLHRQKRRGICSEAELDLKPSESCNIDLDSQLCSQKRRGICSLTQLGLELITDEDNYVEKSFSSLDKLKTNSLLSLNVKDKTLDTDILDTLPITNLVTGETCAIVIPENILIRGRLNTPVISESGETTITAQLSEKSEEVEKHHEEETMSVVTSVHDYENLCPLGVARPPWCIRSWKGYTDIETYIHDDSVVRDRRRDTLTSTATGTTISSDFSDNTYTSLRKFMKRSRQDDYLDTLIYDLVDWESISNKAHTEEVSTATSESIDEPQVQEQTNLFSAKPIVIDEKGGMLALDTILEEDTGIGSFSDLRMNFRNPSSTCSVSSLVATIDEIRKCTAENSPRHVYHRTESQWEDREQKILMKRTSHLTKVLFANDYSNVTLSYGDPWYDTFVSDVNTDKLSIIREVTNYCLKDSNGKTPLINAILSDSPILAPKTETQTCGNDDLIEEDNVYVDMNALGAQKCSSENHKDQEPVLKEKNVMKYEDNGTTMREKSDHSNRKKVAFVLTDEIINDSLETCSEESDSSSLTSASDLKSVPFIVNTKLPLIRERPEINVNEQVVSMVPPPINRPLLNSLNKQISSILDNSDTLDDKENLTMKEGHSDNLKEKRSLFLKQVLSPPKFQGWGKKRTFSPNAKIISKAH